MAGAGATATINAATIFCLEARKNATIRQAISAKKTTFIMVVLTDNSARTYDAKALTDQSKNAIKNITPFDGCEIAICERPNVKLRGAPLLARPA
ncbi:MAG TPA: hypothetical protein VMW50_12865 [Dehalococcoidia bacterium]|nr:hypothetical protein [Dehalococcoidia bacterium]